MRGSLGSRLAKFGETAEALPPSLCQTSRYPICKYLASQATSTQNAPTNAKAQSAMSFHSNTFTGCKIMHELPAIQTDSQLSVRIAEQARETFANDPELW
jgi:hypothetical protein